jgi:hypothetical protein
MGEYTEPELLLIRGREEGVTEERERILGILAAVGNEHYSAPARRVLREISERIYAVVPPSGII